MEASNTTDSLIKTYLASSSIRPEILFRHFLPKGYRATTLSSVDESAMDAVVFAKVHLGMIVTLYDDLADHPKHRNPKLLEELYGLNLERDRLVPDHLNSDEKKIFELARFLFSQLASVLSRFSHYPLLAPVLRFDIEQFYSCNRHSELMAFLPSIRNLTESRTLGPYNMGMVAAGTIDLMASSQLVAEELGKCREVFILGQRLGRISNVIFTLHREISEGDSTNEILISGTSPYSENLIQEFSEKLIEIRSFNLNSFSTLSYAEGLLELHQLHSSLEGRI